MRREVLCLLGGLLPSVALGCGSKASSGVAPERSAPPPSSSAEGSSREVIARIQRELQASRLRVPPQTRHVPRLAFGRGTIARLVRDGLQVLDEVSLESLAKVTLAEPRAVLTMADGSFIVVGARGLARWEREKGASVSGATLVLFPGSSLYADSRDPNRLWVVEPDVAPVRLRGYEVGGPLASGVLLPAQTVELEGPSGGTFGFTREGVWLYVTPGRVERLAPQGARLPGLSLGDAPLPTWVRPSRRLDQAAWLSADGASSRALVSPSFKTLATARLPGAPYAAEVADEGRLLSLVTVTGAGPQFELVLLDASLRELGRKTLPSDTPTGDGAWLQVVTENQQLAASPRAARVALGGPSRLTIHEWDGSVILSKSIQ